MEDGILLWNKKDVKLDGATHEEVIREIEEFLGMTTGHSFQDVEI